MATLQQLKDKAEKVNITAIVDQIFIENERQILTIYQETQLSKGKDQNNEAIGVYTDSWYEHYYKPSIRPDWHGIFDLHLTGRLYENQTIVNHKDGNFYQIIAPTVPYFYDLMKRYGVKWMGFSTETLKKVIDTVLWPKLIQKVKGLTNL